MSKWILVTGGCGYIGSVLVTMLLERGYKVRVFDKLYFGEEPLKGVRDRIELVAGDVRNLNPAILDDVEGVVHLGGLSNDPTAAFDPKANYSINFDGTVKLAQACKERRINRFTFASGCAVYGFFADGIATENTSVNPQSDYAKSKLDAEIALIQMADKNFCPVILRQGTVFGLSPRMRWDLVINAFVMQAFKTKRLEVIYGGEAWRPVVNVNDVAKAHICCLEAEPDKMRGQIFHVVYGNYRVLEMAHRVRSSLKQMGIDADVDVNYDKADNRSYQVSNKKLMETLGFTPRVSIEEGAKEIALAVKSGKYSNFDHPIYYNLPWMQLLIDVEEMLKKTGKVLGEDIA